MLAGFGFDAARGRWMYMGRCTSSSPVKPHKINRSEHQSLNFKRKALEFFPLRTTS